MLYPVVNDLMGHPYCGPTAIASITGEPISAVEEMCKKSLRLPPRRIIGLNLLVSVLVLRKFGYTVQDSQDWYKPNRIRPIEFPLMFQDGPYLIMTKGHFLAYSEGEFVDTSNHFPQPFERWPGRLKPYNQSVETAYRLRRIV